MAFPATAPGGLSWHLAVCGLWLLGGLCFPLGHIPHEIGGPPPPPLMLRCWEDRAGPPQTSGLPHRRAWAPCHLVPKRCSGKRGTRVPRAPAGSLGPWCHQPLVGVLGTPGHISCGRGRATVLHPQRPSREQGSCGQCGLMGGVSCLLCPPRPEPSGIPPLPRPDSHATGFQQTRVGETWAGTGAHGAHCQISSSCGMAMGASSWPPCWGRPGFSGKPTAGQNTGAILGGTQASEGGSLGSRAQSCAELSLRDIPARSHRDTTGPRVLGAGRDPVGGAAPQLLD